MWFELKFRFSFSFIKKEDKPAIRYCYSPVTHSWWSIKSGVVNKPGFDVMMINKSKDVAEAKEKIVKGDDDVGGYDTTDIIYYQASINCSRIRCLHWACFGFNGERGDDGTVRYPRLPWRYGWHHEYKPIWLWGEQDDNRLVFHERRPCYLTEYETTENGFNIAGITSNECGDLLWHSIHAVEDDTGTFCCPVYRSTVTSYLFYINDNPTGIPEHPISYTVCHRLDGMDDTAVAWRDVGSEEQTRLAARLLFTPASGIGSVSLLPF